MKIRFLKAVILAAILSLPIAAAAQKAGVKTVKKPAKPAPVVTAPPQPTPDPVPDVPVKRNERPAETATTSGVKTKSHDGVSGVASTAVNSPVYSYEFERLGFTYSPILIEHDDAGKGKISFKKDGAGDLLTDPINLSAATIEKIKAAFAALNFLDSTANYQYVKDFSNMGNVTVTLNRDGRSRSAKFNWTEIKDAKVLYDEYRRIGNEYIWKFEMTVGRENQPLQTPGLMDELDSYLSRNEISDPERIMPFLTELSTDERLPLIARNHAAKLIKRIEKVVKK